MRQRCSEEYWKGMEKFMAPEAPCGRVFEDVDQSTQCPHEPLGMRGLVCKHTDLLISVCPHCNKKEAK